MKKLTLLLPVFLLLPFFSIAQSVVLSETLGTDTLPEKFGPNLSNYLHTYVAYGFIMGNANTTGYQIDSYNSYEFNSGLRYKKKLSNNFAMGLNLNYHMQSFRLKQNNQKTLPSPTIYNKEKFIINQIELEWYNRINFGKRGNIIGKYIDIGVYGDWVVSSKYYRRIENKGVELATLGKYTEIIDKKLPYVQPLNCGVSLKLGWETFAIYGKYRLTNMMNPSFGFPELPKLSFGIEMSVIN
jgi:hypothetical protein